MSGKDWHNIEDRLQRAEETGFFDGVKDEKKRIIAIINHNIKILKCSLKNLSGGKSKFYKEYKYGIMICERLKEEIIFKCNHEWECAETESPDIMPTIKYCLKCGKLEGKL
jgi:hypothetical protein